MKAITTRCYYWKLMCNINLILGWEDWRLDFVSCLVSIMHGTMVKQDKRRDWRRKKESLHEDLSCVRVHGATLMLIFFLRKIQYCQGIWQLVASTKEQSHPELLALKSFYWKWKVSCVRLLATPWTIDYHAPLSMGFSKQELPSPSPGDLPDPGIERGSPAL